MEHKTQETEEKKPHHFLFYIFSMDKTENPMPKSRAETLLGYLKNVFKQQSK